MYRGLATANAFAKSGWKVTVLTATEKTFEQLTGADPQTLSAIDSRVEVVRIPFDPERGESDLSKWSRLRVFSPMLWLAFRWLKSLFQFPEIGYGSWKVPLIRATERIQANSPVDLVVATANPNVDYVPAQHLYRKYRVPYVLDQRDSWHLNVYSGTKIGSRFSRSNRFERKMIDHATEAWFVNAPIRDWHRSEYSENADNFHVVANGYDPMFLSNVRRKKPNPNALTFGYLGTIYGPQPLRETLEGWRIARSRSEQLANAKLFFYGRLGHFAETDLAAANMLQQYVDDQVIYAGPVSKTDVSRVYSEFDALLLILSSSKYVTSGKVFEYASTGLPIAALFDPITAAGTALSGYPLLESASEVSASNFAEVIIRTAELAAGSNRQQVESAKIWARRFARDEQLLPRIEELKTKISGRRK